MVLDQARMRALVNRLKAGGYDSEHLRRLEAHLSVEERQEALEAEMRSEMAAALGRTTARLEAAMLELELATAALENAENPETEAEFEAARRQAVDARRDLQIHREALGIRQAVVLHHRYPIPGPRPKGEA